MKVKRVARAYDPIPPIYEPSFGIYKCTRQTPYGYCTYGSYKGYRIDISYDEESKAKLFYITDKFSKWVRYKFSYFQGGVKRIVKGENKDNFSKIV